MLSSPKFFSPLSRSSQISSWFSTYHLCLGRKIGLIRAGPLLVVLGIWAITFRLSSVSISLKLMVYHRHSTNPGAFNSTHRKNPQSNMLHLWIVRLLIFLTSKQKIVSLI
jgi:hypothetical protein